MTLTLTSTEEARFTATARALLSPLDLSSLDGWRACVLEHITRLLEADSGGFILEASGEPPCTLHNLPERFAREYFETFWKVDVGREIIRKMGGGVWSTRLLVERLGLEAPEDWYRSPGYRLFYGRYAIRDSIGFVALPDRERISREPTDSDEGPIRSEAVLTCFSRTWGTDYFGERGLELLRLLLPALESGASTRMRLPGRHTALEAAFESSSSGVAVYEMEERRPLYRNAAFERLLESEPPDSRLRPALERGLRSLSGLALPNGVVEPDRIQETSREIRTSLARYRVRFSLIGAGSFSSAPAALATVERLTPVPPSVRALQERWRLTPQEARVATHIARGETNQEIAAALRLSPATTRHYTEAMFLKLGVHSRAEATAKILLG